MGSWLLAIYIGGMVASLFWIVWEERGLPPYRDLIWLLVSWPVFACILLIEFAYRVIGAWTEKR